MEILTHVGGFGYRDLQHTFRKKVSPNFSDTDWTKSGLFVKHDQASRHKRTIG